ncbi:kinase-like domain-containing protein [Hyaloraphidium curvatum]|nr:kinase-like domain-containing protein [Hyaloraphidium curvatum]
MTTALTRLGLQRAPPPARDLPAAPAPAPAHAAAGPREPDFIFPDSPALPAGLGEDSPTTAVDDGQLPPSKIAFRDPPGIGGRPLRALDAALAEELVLAAEARHNRSVSSNSSASNKSASSTGSGPLPQIRVQPKQRRFGPGLVHYQLLSNIVANASPGGVEDISFLFYGRHIPTGDEVTLKYTDLGISSTPELLDSMIASIRNAFLCQHEYILPYLCSYVEDGCLWTVSPPVRAGSCRSLLEEHFPGGFGEVTVATILRKLLLALSYMHDNSMVHNDIRAANILMDITGEIRVTGLHSVSHLQGPGHLRRTAFSPPGSSFEHAAPEILAQADVHDEKADLYAVGITALELAYNRTPFDGWPPLKILLCKMKYPCPPLATGKEMPAEFHDFVEQCLQRDPSKRPSARALLNHPFLRGAKGKSHLEKHVVRPTGIRERHERAARAHKEEGRRSPGRESGSPSRPPTA